MNAPIYDADSPEWQACLDRLREQRQKQGLPPTIENPAVIRRLARLILRAADRIEAQERRAK